jgi:hypothetical protein
VAAVPSGPNWTPPPTIQIKKILKKKNYPYVPPVNAKRVQQQNNAIACGGYAGLMPLQLITSKEGNEKKCIRDAFKLLRLRSLQNVDLRLRLNLFVKNIRNIFTDMVDIITSWA